MDNQQPSSEKEKVQRLSHKGVLNDSLIIWETPPSENKIYLYFLKTNKNIRYVGITNDPKTRLSHHISYRNKTNNYKDNWLKSEINSGNQIIMIIKESFVILEDALIREEYFINSLLNLTNFELNPTIPNSKYCYLYNLQTQEIKEFNSLNSCSSYLNITPSALYRNVIKGKYLFSYSNNFKDVIKQRASLKIKLYKTNEIKYAISYKHAAWILGCTKGMINALVIKTKKTYKYNQVVKINESFVKYPYKTHKKIQCVNDGKVFNSIAECGRFYDLDSSNILKTAKGLRKQYKGLNFIFIDDIVQP